MKTITNHLTTVLSLTVSLLTLSSTSVTASILANYSFPAGSWESSVTEPNTDISIASSGNSSGVLVSAGAQNLYYQFAIQHNKAEAIASDYYAAFTLTPDAGYRVSYSELSFNYGGSFGNSVGEPSYQANFFIRSSLDGFSSDLTEFSYTVPGLPDEMTPEFLVLDLSSHAEFQFIDEAVTFRIYAFTDNFVGSAFTHLARPRLDNIVLEGTVGAIPEPATAALLMAVTLAGVVVWIRRRR